MHELTFSQGAEEEEEEEENEVVASETPALTIDGSQLTSFANKSARPHQAALRARRQLPAQPQPGLGRRRADFKRATRPPDDGLTGPPPSDVSASDDAPTSDAGKCCAPEWAARLRLE